MVQSKREHLHISNASLKALLPEQLGPLMFSGLSSSNDLRGSASLRTNDLKISEGSWKSLLYIRPILVRGSAYPSEKYESQWG